ncbi:glycosyltransferase family 4 protein [Pacificimonas sp. WHA3]|uniref:Glycosyltransferase family 4 protein n=2 Tax=Pacificimonas pallii TaxID=2827236 RepID=A0ABS6SBB9_9SPHN|nr:glycosyltransferase family 4 protein [Pacificimonas pallii]
MRAALAPARGGPRFHLDLSRLMSRVHHPAPTGVDRVEMAYATHLPQLLGSDLGYVARHPTGLFGALRPDDVARFLDREQAKWAGVRAAGSGHTLKTLAGAVPRLAPPGRGGTMILASPSNLHNRARFRAMKRSLDARLVALVHDLIPLTHPEYARPDGAAKHAARMETLRLEADALVTNSASTAAALHAFWEAADHPPIHASRLGVDIPRPGEPTTRARPYFLCVSTIEPRKNHLLLLQVWRHFAETRAPEDIPELLVVGRRGWENEHILDLLERGPATRPHVRELGPLAEPELTALMRGARALLMPSFAEGFGLPVAEALAVGTPVIASNLAAHHDAGGEVPEFLSPLDGDGWGRAILDYMTDGPRREAQRARMADWQAPAWDAHLDTVIAAAEAVMA